MTIVSYTGAIMAAPQRVIVWAEPAQERLIRDAIDAADLELIAVGGTTPVAAARVAELFNVPAVMDLRAAVQREDVDSLWLAAAEPVDASFCAMLKERQIACFTSMPPAVSLADLISGEIDAGLVQLAPMMRRSPGFRAAESVLGSFGEIECAAVEFRSGAGEGALLTRLCDAFDVTTRLLGEAAALDAASFTPPGGSADSLAALRGHMTTNLRARGPGCAAVLVSDRGGGWLRRITVLGPAGSLVIDDAGFTWQGVRGEPIDAQRIEPVPSPGELIGRQIRRTLDHLDVDLPPLDLPRLLALAEAARLSCRTGQPEAPARMLEILGRP